METTYQTPSKDNKIVLIAIASLFSFLSFLSFFLHIHSDGLISLLEKASESSFFLIGFISLAIAIVSIRFYFQHPMHSSKQNRYSSQLRQKRIIRRHKMRGLIQKIRNRATQSKTKSDAVSIEKSDLQKIRFTKIEVLENEEEKMNRKINLQKALQLGNLYKQKVSIYFENEGSKKHTHATVWHVDDKNVCLKGGAFIPVHSIYKIVL